LAAPVEEIEARLAEAKNCRKAYVASRRKLAEGHLRLVVMEAVRHRRCRLDMSDIMQEGVVGLLRAADRFEYRLGHSFATYALIWIRQAISRAVSYKSRTVRAPVHLVNKLRKLRTVIETASHDLGRSPNSADLMAATGLSAAKLWQVETAGGTPASLEENARVPSDGDGSDPDQGRDCVPSRDTSEPVDHAESRSLSRAVAGMLASLPYRERAVVEMRFGLGDGHQYSVADTAAVIGESADAVAVIEADAVSRLRPTAESLGYGQ
jgi:RNA polymerase primary sigma factor